MARSKETDRDMMPFGDTLPEEMTFQELLDAGVIDIAEVDNRVQMEQRELVGRSFILVNWEIKDSDRVKRDGQPTQYAFVEVMLEDGTLAVFADGGSGIMDQLKRYDARLLRSIEPGAAKPRLYFHYGLRVSDYTYTDPQTGDQSPASTFYFDNRRRP